ncbi:MAG TPA: HNH endonuclease signature motif containing protein [Pirellulales bacterium]|nr:HNH endonuclease signature motif containing protein [Pirellulales bacterium]
MTQPSVFDYPTSPHARRHGPQGYADLGSYRNWLRDDFCFRCVFCLQREQWQRRCAMFHIDHFVPRQIEPNRVLDYDNLLYVCASCNSIKGDLAVPDPCQVAYGDCVRVLSDGRIEALNQTGDLLIGLLSLDDGDAVRYRKLVIDTLDVLRHSANSATYLEWVRFPDDLPDLSLKQPPGGNNRPKGVEQSWFAKRRRGELPASY